MKKLLIAFISSLIACVLCGVTWAGDAITMEAYGATLGTGSACLLPAHGIKSVPDWATNINLYCGAVIRATNEKNYLVVNSPAGVTTNSPTNLVSYIAADSAVYRPVYAVRELRKGMAVYNYSTCVVWCAFGQAAVAGQGIRLAPSTGSLVLDGNVPQEAFYIISSTTNATISSQEW